MLRRVSLILLLIASLVAAPSGQAGPLATADEPQAYDIVFTDTFLMSDDEATGETARSKAYFRQLFAGAGLSVRFRPLPIQRGLMEAAERPRTCYPTAMMSADRQAVLQAVFPSFLVRFGMWRLNANGPKDLKTVGRIAAVQGLKSTEEAVRRGVKIDYLPASAEVMGGLIAGGKVDYLVGDGLSLALIANQFGLRPVLVETYLNTTFWFVCHKGIDPGDLARLRLSYAQLLKSGRVAEIWSAPIYDLLDRESYLAEADRFAESVLAEQAPQR